MTEVSHVLLAVVIRQNGYLTLPAMQYAITFLVGLLAGVLLALPVEAQALTVAQADSLRLSLRQ
jgi:hypothetical protein